MVVASAVGVALVVLFAGAGVILAVGATVTTEFWAAASALSGALVGILSPPPATKAAGQRQAAEQRTQAAEAAMSGHPNGTDRSEVVKKLAEESQVQADKAPPDYRIVVLVIIGAAAFAVGVWLALMVGHHEIATQYDTELKNAADTLISLGSAAAGAILGVLAPTPSKTPKN